MNKGLSRFVVLFIVALGVVINGQRAWGDDPSLEAWWSFNTDVQEGVSIIDDTGNGYDAYRNGGTTLVVNGISGQAVSFDGVDGYLNVPQGVVEGHDVGNFGTDDFTISYWIKTTATRTEGVMGKRVHCSGPHSFWDFRRNTFGSMFAELYHDTNITNRNSFSGRRVLNDGIWHQLVYTREGQTATMYLDGKQDLSNSAPLVVNLFNTADLWMGRSACSNGGDGTKYYTGELDEVRVYNRALTCPEVRAGYEAFFDVLDFNRDTAVDLADVFYLAGQWLEIGVISPANPISPADVAPGCGDGTVNFFDYAALAAEVGP